MEKETVKRYSEALKQQIVREYEKGTSIYKLRQKYGIGGYTTIKNWIKKYGKEGLRSELIVIQSADEQVEVKAMKSRIQELESALAESVLENRMLTATLEVASQHFAVDIKKNYGKR